MIDLTYIEKYRENNRIEAKKALGGLPKSIWETYSAFANTMGGVILLGVEEINKSFHPINLPHPQLLISEFWQIINDKKKISKNIITKQHIKILHKDNCCFIAIFVPRAQKSDMPVYVDNDPFRGTYKRNGEGDYKANSEEITLMLKSAKEPSFDANICNLPLTSLNKNSLESFWKLCSVDCDKFDFFKSIYICNEVLHITQAALLMFGNYTTIIEHFPDFKLSLKNENIETFKGNLFDFYIYVNGVFNRILTDDEVRISLREALLNAIINADYNSGCNVSIEVFASHISFTNAGTFLVDINDAKNGFVSTPRNPLIKRFFDSIKPIDIFTGGLSYIHMIWQKNGWSAPYFQQAHKATVLKLYFYNIAFLNNTPDIIKSETIICYLTEHIFADIHELSKILNLPQPDTEKITQKMLDNDIIISVQKNNNLLYKLKD